MNLANFLSALDALTKVKPEDMQAAANDLLSQYQAELAPNEFLAILSTLKAYGVPFDGDKDITLSDGQYHPQMPPHQFGDAFKHHLYGFAYEICALAYLFEKNGVIEEHATKLAVMFKDQKNLLDYLVKYAQSAQFNKTPIHDACLFSLPEFSEAGFNDEKEGCHFSLWKDLANQKDRMMDRDFKMMLPFAWYIEKEIRKGLQEAKQTKFKRNNDAINEKKEDIRIKLKRFNDLERVKSDLDEEDEEEYDQLSKQISIARQELAALLKGKFLKDMSTDEIRAFFEVYKCQQDPAYLVFLDNGIPPKYFEIFESLVCQQDKKAIPEVLFDGTSLNYPDCYLKSVNVLDKAEAARAACFGKMTDCCQSISGEAGQPCVIHGLTSPNGGFYVVCRGDVNNPKVTDPVLGMSWAWRSKNNAIVFDSVEISKDERKEEDQVRLWGFFMTLGLHLIENGHTHKVVCGATSGLSGIFGNYYSVNPREKFIDYNGYCDSNVQRVIYDISSPFYEYDNDIKSTEDTIDIIRKVMENPAPFGTSEAFFRMLNFAIIERKDSIIDEIAQRAREVGRSKELQTFMALVISFVEENAQFAPKMISAFEKGDLSVNLKTRRGLSPLLVAILSNDRTLTQTLLDMKADVDDSDLNWDTPLIHAIREKHHDLVRLLLNHGARVDTANQEGKSPIHIAAQYGDKEMIDILLAHGANIEDFDGNWTTPIMEAAIKGNKVALEALLDVGANVSATDNNGRTALHHAAYNARVSCFDILMQYGANIQHIDDNYHTPLTLGIACSQQAASVPIINQLVKLGADITLVDEAGNNIALECAFNCDNYLAMVTLLTFLEHDHDVLLLHKALEYNTPDFIPHLLSLGWNINQRDSEGDAPLHLACLAKEMVALKMLLEANADVNAQGKDGKTALHILIERNPDWSYQKMDLLLAVDGLNMNLQDSEGQTPLFASVIRCDTNAMNKLLDKGADIEKPNNQGRSPLIAALIGRRMDIAHLLMQKGASLDAKDEFGASLLEIVARQNDTEMVLTMLDKGFDINNQDMYGFTPLHHAVMNNNDHLINKLIERGANPNIQDNLGNAPLFYAVKKESIHAVEQLISCGAMINAQNKEGKSALHVVSDERMIKLLIEKGADTKLLDNEDCTALIQLEKRRYRRLVIAFKKCQQEYDSQQSMKENVEENTPVRPKTK